MSLFSRLAKQAASFYQDVKGLLSCPPLSQHFDRSWISHATVKATLYEAETQSQAAIGLHAEQEVAPEIARIKASHWDAKYHCALSIAVIEAPDTIWDRAASESRAPILFSCIHEDIANQQSANLISRCRKSAL